MSIFYPFRINVISRLLLIICIGLFFGNCNKNYYKKIDSNYFKTDESTYKFKDFVYEGVLSEDGIPIGKGKITYNNGVIASGYFNNGNLEDNNAYVYIPAVGTFTGKCINGILNYGTIKYKSGDIYTGMISNYQPNGKGEYRKKHLILVGAFTNGTLHGPGAIIDTITKIRTYSQFRYGLPNGISGIEQPNQKIQYIDYENGIDVTKAKKDNYITNQVKTIEFKELKPQQDSIEIVKSKIEQLNIKFQEYKFNYKSPGSACLRSGMYLTVSPQPKEGEREYSWSSGFGTSIDNISSEQMQDEFFMETVYYGYSADYKERSIEKEVKVIGPTSLTRSEIQQLLRVKKSIIAEKKLKEAKLNDLCEKWNRNPKEFQQEIEEYLNKDYYSTSNLLTMYNNLLENLNNSVENRIIEQQRLQSYRREQANMQYNKLAEDKTAEIKSSMCLFRPCLFCPPKNAKVTCQ